MSIEERRAFALSLAVQYLDTKHTPASGVVRTANMFYEYLAEGTVPR